MSSRTEPKLYTVAQATNWLAARGVRRNARTLRRWIHTEHIRARRIGGRVYIEESELVELLDGTPIGDPQSC